MERLDVVEPLRGRGILGDLMLGEFDGLVLGSVKRKHCADRYVNYHVAWSGTTPDVSPSCVNDEPPDLLLPTLAPFF